jgi:hypothetical protein
LVDLGTRALEIDERVHVSIDQSEAGQDYLVSMRANGHKKIGY